MFGSTPQCGVCVSALTVVVAVVVCRYLQVFQCLLPDSEGGGKTVLVDGFKIAAVMKERYPEAYQYFCTHPVPFHHIDEETDHRTMKKVLFGTAHDHAFLSTL